MILQNVANVLIIDLMEVQIIAVLKRCYWYVRFYVIQCLLAFLIKILLERCSDTPMKNTFNNCFIAEFCLSQSQTYTQKPTDSHARDWMWALRYMKYSRSWNNWGSEFLLGIWVTDQRITLSLLNETSPITWERDSVLLPSSGECWFTLCWLSCNRVCSNWNKEGLLSHSSKSMFERILLSFRNGLFESVGLSQFDSKMFWWKEQFENWIEQWVHVRSLRGLIR